MEGKGHSMGYGSRDHEDDLLAWEREYRDAGEPFYGDPRRCPVHPHVRTSSDDGMFDGPCGECEAAMDYEPDDTKFRATAQRTAPPVARPVVLQGPFDDDDIPF